jgi:uncharacterized protein (DUF1697 family)
MDRCLLSLFVRMGACILTRYVALLRAVNVGGTGKLPMSDLKAMCEDASCEQVSTYIASGNVVFSSNEGEDEIRTKLEGRLRDYAGKDVGVIVRTATEIAGVLSRNPFPHAPGNQVIALFHDGPMPDNPQDGVTGMVNEQIVAGARELFVHYPDGMARTRLRIPAEKNGTARNMNTVAKLAEMAADPG